MSSREDRKSEGSAADAADRLAWLLGEVQKSQESIAEEIGVNPTYLPDMKAGRAPITRKTARAIERAYGYRADWLLEGKGPRKEESRACEGQAGYDVGGLAWATTEALLAEVGRRLDALLSRLREPPGASRPRP